MYYDFVDKLDEKEILDLFQDNTFETETIAVCQCDGPQNNGRYTGCCYFSGSPCTWASGSGYYNPDTCTSACRRRGWKMHNCVRYNYWSASEACR